MNWKRGLIDMRWWFGDFRLFFSHIAGFGDYTVLTLGSCASSTEVATTASQRQALHAPMSPGLRDDLTQMYVHSSC